MGDSTSNVIESLHADVNSEGIACSLVGGIHKGHHFDNLKLKTLSVFEMTGIGPSYHSGHVSEASLKSIKRKSHARRKGLVAQDTEIKKRNTRLQEASDAWDRATRRLACSQMIANNPRQQEATIKRISEAHGRATATYHRAVAESMKVAGTGTGKVGLLLPRSAVGQ